MNGTRLRREMQRVSRQRTLAKRERERDKAERAGRLSNETNERERSTCNDSQRIELVLSAFSDRERATGAVTAHMESGLQLYANVHCKSR